MGPACRLARDALAQRNGADRAIDRQGPVAPPDRGRADQLLGRGTIALGALGNRATDCSGHALVEGQPAHLQRGQHPHHAGGEDDQDAQPPGHGTTQNKGRQHAQDQARRVFIGS